METTRRREVALFAALPPFGLLFVAPLTFYFANRGEYPFGLGEAAPYLLAGFAVVWGVLAAALLALGRWPRAQRVAAGLLLGAGATIWLQSQLLAWDFGPLDGRGVEWALWRAHGVVEAVLWVTLLAAGAALATTRPRTSATAGGALLLLGVLSVAGEVVMAEEPPRYEDDHRVFSLHPEANTLLIVLDTFQGDALQEIIDRWPRDVEFLDGFTFYRNVLAGFPTTIASIPLLLTGERYDNQEPIQDFVGRANGERNVARAFHARGYESTCAASLMAGLTSFRHVPPEVASAVAMQRVMLDPGAIGARGALNLVDAGLFRAVPVWAKPWIYRQGDWLLTRIPADPELPRDFHGVDVRFAHAFQRLARIDSEAAGVFKFLHFGTPHFPLRMDERLRPVRDPGPTRENYLAQARGGLRLVRQVLEPLKRHGVYRASEIVVVSDHGTRRHRVEVDGQPPRWGWGPGFAESTHSAGLPILLHKPAGARGPLAVSEAPLHLGDVPCLLAADSGLYDCSGLEAALAGEERPRLYHDYPWRHEYWGRTYLPPMTEYRVAGHAWDPSAWTDTGLRLAPEGVTRAATSPRVAVGERIEFHREGTSDRVVQFGWSYAEDRFRWTVGPEAGLLLRLDEPPRADLLLSLVAHPFLADGAIESQRVTLRTDGVEVARWEVRRVEELTARIPRRLSADGNLRLELLISNPASPHQHGISTDTRELGLAVRWLDLASADQAGGRVSPSFVATE